jgi:hypothetical protein
MGFTKDLWTRAEKQPDDTIRRVRNPRWGNGKRWLSVWHDESGREQSQAFGIKDAADKHWKAMETNRERGEYVDPKAGRELMRGVGKRWLASRSVDPSSVIRYESLGRLHVEPVFGRRQVKAVKPSDIQAFLATLGRTFGNSTAAGCYLILQGCFELAMADGQIKRNPARSPVVTKPRAGLGGKVQAWADETVWKVIDARPDHLGLMAVLMAACGLRIAEAMALSVDDIDFDAQEVHVRRQLKKLGEDHVFGLPKSDLERDVPLPEWAAASVRVHGPSPAVAMHAAVGEDRRETAHAQPAVPVGRRQLCPVSLVQRAGVEACPGQCQGHPGAGDRPAEPQAVRDHPQGRAAPAPALLRQRDARWRGVGQGAGAVPRPQGRGVHAAGLHPPAAKLPRPGPAGYGFPHVPAAGRG